MPLLVGHRELTARPAGVPNQEPEQALLPASCRSLIGLLKSRLKLSHHINLHHSHPPQPNAPANTNVLNASRNQEVIITYNIAHAADACRTQLKSLSCKACRHRQQVHQDMQGSVEASAQLLAGRACTGKWKTITLRATLCAQSVWGRTCTFP